MFFNTGNQNNQIRSAQETYIKYLMNKISLCLLIVLLFVNIHSQTRSILTLTIPEGTNNPKINNFGSIRFPVQQTDASVYRGQAKIEILDGDKSRIQYFITYFQRSDGCTYKKCFYGFVNNYTLYDEDGQTFVEGYKNDELTVKPVFKFETNGPQDYEVTHATNLQFVWAEIIQISCQKFNPLIQVEAKAEIPKFTLPKISAGAPVIKQESRYKFTPNVRSSPEIKYGRKLATVSEPIKIENFATRKSILSESVRLNDEGLVGMNRQQYSFDVLNQKSSRDSLKIPDLVGKVEIDLFLQEKIKVLTSTANSIVQAINVKKRGVPIIKLSAQTLQINRIGRVNIELIPDQLIYNNEPKPGDFDSVHFDNERYTGVNVIERFKKEKPSLPVFNTDTLVTLPVNTLPGTTFPKRGTRLLPPISKTTIVDNTRTLWSRTIFGKPVNVKFRTFCQLWQWPTDHQIHCEGWILFNFFGNKNTYKVFDFTKSVSFIWNYKDQWSGGKGFKIWIGLPKPVDFIGLNFYISVKYKVNLAVKAEVIDFSPYTIRIRADTTAKLDTDSSAGLKLIVVEGGVFIKGTLARVKTSPQAIAKYLFPQQKIQLRIRWYAELFTFEAEWGFYWRRWRLFKGWTGKMIIKKWKIKNNYYKFKVIDSKKVISV